MKIVVTGASGFVGSNLIKVLAEEHELLGISRSAINADIPHIAADINSIVELPQDYDVLIHAAGLAHIQSTIHTRNSFHLSNVNGTSSALRLARQAKVKHFILVSSIAALSSADDDFYAESKRIAEINTISECEKYNIPYTIIRPVMVYGEDDKKGNMNKLIGQLKKGYFPLLDSGKTIKNMIYIHNLTHIVKISMLNDSFYSRAINARDNETLNMRTICKEITAAIGRKTYLIPLPRFPFLTAMYWMKSLQPTLNYLGVRFFDYTRIDSILKLTVNVNVPSENFDLPFSSQEAIQRTVKLSSNY